MTARRALQHVSPQYAAVLPAGIVAWATHAAIDWDSEMPAVTLLAILLAGALMASGEATPTPDVASASLEEAALSLGESTARGSVLEAQDRALSK